MPIRALSIANRNLLDSAVLTKELGLAQRFKQFVFADRWCQPSDIDQIFLDNPHADQVFAVFFLGLAFLGLFLTLFGGTILLILLDPVFELGNPIQLLAYRLGPPQLSRRLTLPASPLSIELSCRRRVFGMPDKDCSYLS